MPQRFVKGRSVALETHVSQSPIVYNGQARPTETRKPGAEEQAVVWCRNSKGTHGAKRPCQCSLRKYNAPSVVSAFTPLGAARCQSSLLSPPGTKAESRSSSLLHT
ncbi:hypothetical protein NDU88_003228 [Pleurodeles waltl]|uniref:Uncharacterized protein n=1 Tax=Pleurodeles waltl TaxID=8319 RepID=A0AAV7TN07_PLEWA|nr:hypothetical protein NDU88_003228 [Pleurodeles waltl]